MSDATASDEVDVPDRPGVPGLVFRRFRGLADYPGMVEANMAARDAYGVMGTVSVEGLTAQYAPPDEQRRRTRPRDHRARRADRRLLPGRVDRPAGRQPRLPAHRAAPRRSSGAGASGPRCSPGWSGGCVRSPRSTRTMAGHAGCRPAAGMATPSGTRLLARHGYRPMRKSYEMVRPTMDEIPEASLPTGLEVRPVTRADFRRLFQADVEAFRDHWGEIDESEEAFLSFRGRPGLRPVALPGGVRR